MLFSVVDAPSIISLYFHVFLRMIVFCVDQFHWCVFVVYFFSCSCSHVVPSIDRLLRHVTSSPLPSHQLTGHKSRLASAASQPARQQNPARPMTSATCDDVTRVVKTATVCVERCRHCPASMSLRSFLMHKKGWKMLSSDPAKGVESSRVLICFCYWFYCPRLW